MLLKDKVVIVSGIGPGLGVKLAVEAAREGARGVVAVARSAGNLDDAEQRVRALGTKCAVLKVPTDITDPAQCKRAAARAVAEFGRIDGLVNSAYFHGKFESVVEPDLAEWQEVYRTNVIGSMQMTLAVVPQMKSQGGGAVVMVNTMATLKPYPGEAGYAASKGALLSAAKYLAIELGPHNIRVNTSRPGWMWGYTVEGAIRMMAEAQGRTEQQVKDEIASTKALKRIVTDDECAQATLFLVSDYASSITGAILDCNGGEVMPA
ncbi:MAG: Dihydroanticapsin 7-dehydrogenase [Steroidobacteraceae bacterium]|nr:Dihydroanticapsin 7-dehydrogenase [Steroidobacteraceae bacterium]